MTILTGRFGSYRPAVAMDTWSSGIYSLLILLQLFIIVLILLGQPWNVGNYFIQMQMLHQPQPGHSAVVRANRQPPITVERYWTTLSTFGIALYSTV